MTVLSCRVDRAGYGQLVVLPSLEVAVSQRELLVLLGPNGAGKTTALRSLVGTVDTRARSLTLDGTDISRLSAWQLAQAGIAFVPDGARCFVNATVGENLEGAFDAVRAKARASRRNELRTLTFEMFPILRDRLGQIAGSMSGGQRQMLAIARALMIEPTVLILDEPSAGLSPKMVEELFSALGRIKEITSCAIIMAEQNFAAAVEIADRCMVLEEGHVVLSGSVEEVSHNERLRIAYLGL